MKSEKASIFYDGSKLVFCFFLIFIFPISVVLFLLNARVRLEEKTYAIVYSGSQFWIYFWALFFFPIAFLLFALNGVSLTEESTV